MTKGTTSRVDVETIEAELAACRLSIRTRIRHVIEGSLNRRSCLRSQVVVIEDGRGRDVAELAPRSATRALAYLERALNQSQSCAGYRRADDVFADFVKHWDRLTSPLEDHPRSLAPLFDLAAQIHHRRITILRKNDRHDITNDVAARLSALSDLDSAIKHATTLVHRFTDLLAVHERGVLREDRIRLRRDFYDEQAHSNRFANLSSISIVLV